VRHVPRAVCLTVWGSPVRSLFAAWPGRVRTGASSSMASMVVLGQARGARAALGPCTRARSWFFSRGDKRHGGESKSLLQYASSPRQQEEQPSWRRLAEKIKDDDLAADSVYLARLRKNHDPRDHIEKLEEEVLEEIAGALGRTAAKTDYAFFVMDRAERLLDAASHPREQNRLAREFNQARLNAEKARRELMIHRQAVGFTIGNQKSVEKKWALPPPRRIVVDDAEEEERG